MRLTRRPPMPMRSRHARAPATKRSCRTPGTLSLMAACLGGRTPRRAHATGTAEREARGRDGGYPAGRRHARRRYELRHAVVCRGPSQPHGDAPCSPEHLESFEWRCLSSPTVIPGRRSAARIIVAFFRLGPHGAKCVHPQRSESLAPSVEGLRAETRMVADLPDRGADFGAGPEPS